jgi:hypothetical protein
MNDHSSLSYSSISSPAYSPRSRTLIVDSNQRTEFPTAGLHDATLVHAESLELQDSESPTGTRKVVRIFWELDQKDSDGRPFRTSLQLNQKLNDRSRLFEVIFTITGKPPKPPFDLQTLIGRRSTLHIAHTNQDGRSLYVVAEVLPLQNSQQ